VTYGGELCVLLLLRIEKSRLIGRGGTQYEFSVVLRVIESSFLAELLEGKVVGVGEIQPPVQTLEAFLWE
jgi:hypothetical protein